MKRLSHTLTALAVTGVFALAACSGADVEQDYPQYGSDKQHRERMDNLEGGQSTLFGELSIGGPEEKGQAEGTFSSVNFFLWRAALETLSLGPLESADPFGGVIITDWFTLDEDPASQYRVTAYILGRQLRTDNVRVALYVRSQQPDGSLATKRASKEAETRLENVILTKARTIRATQYR